MGKNTLRLLGSLLVLYLGVPLLLFVVRFIKAPQRGFHVAGLFASLGISIGCASLSLVIVIILGLPLAYVLGRSTRPVARLLEAVVTLPLALPPVMGGIILVYLVGPYSVVGEAFGRRLTNSVYGIVIAMTFCSAPFLILSARAAFATIDQGQFDVAATLGHSEVSRFVRVALPAVGPEIRAGITMTWLRAFGEYGAVTILAYNPASLPVYTVNEFMARGIAPTLAPTMLALAVAAGVVAVSRLRLPRLRRVDPRMITPEAPAPVQSEPLRFDVTKNLGTFHLDIQHTSHSLNLAVIGPSGSGKSVLLRALAGLYGTRVGEVSFRLGDGAARPTGRYTVGYVAQDFALFAHLSVWQNLMFAVGVREGTAAYWWHHLKLEGLENRYPSQLSGGQRQRVALAQALCHAPDALLLDEPFSAIDMPRRRELRRELRRLQRETGLATVVVTHDPEEAAVLAQEVIVISGGRLLQSGTVRQVFSRPASSHIAELLGTTNLHRARVTHDGLVGSGGTAIPLAPVDFSTGTDVLWTIRPDRIELGSPGEPSADHSMFITLSGTVTDVADLGVAVDLFVRLDEELELHVRVADSVDFRVGQGCIVRIRGVDIDLWEDSAAGHALVAAIPPAAPGDTAA